MTKLFTLLLLLAPALSHADAVAEAFYRNQAYSLAAEAWRAEIARSDSFAPEARLGLGQSTQRLGDFKAAVHSYKGFLDRHPAHSRAPEAWMGLGLSLQSQGQYEDSQKALAEILANYSRHDLAPQAAFARAENLYHLGRYQEAEEAYRLLRDDYPDFSRPEYLPYSRAWCFYRLGETPSRGGSEGAKSEALEKAADLFGEVVKGWPSAELAPYAQYQQGESYFAAKKFKEAAVAYTRLEERYRDHSLVPAARYSLAWCSFEQGKWPEAAQSFHKFAVVHEDHELAPWAMYLAGVCLARNKEYNLAQSAYELTLKKYPGGPTEDKARFGLAWLATVRKDYPAAALAFDGFLAKFGESALAPPAYFLRADALYHQERYASAREDYLRLLKNYPGHKLADDALFFAAGCSLAQGEHPRALDEYQQFLRLRPQSPYAGDARLRLADAYYGNGDLEQASKAYGLLIKDPKSAQAPYARSGLAWVAFSRRRWSESHQHWKALAESWPQHPLAPESLLHAGDSLYNLGRYGEALESYRSLIQKAPEAGVLADAHYQAGWANYRMKNFDQAYGEWGLARIKSQSEARSSEALYWMAWALFRKGDDLGAARAFGEMREAYPKSHLATESLLRQADSLYNAKSYEEAIMLYQKLVAASPGDARAAAALHGIQWCYYALGRDDEAIAASKAYLEKHKQSEFAPDVQYRVAEHYVNKGDFKQAERELDALKTAYPESKLDLNASYWRGQSRFKNLKFNEAIQDWKGLLQKAPQHNLAPRAAFKIGLAYYRLQEYPEALAAFGVVLDSYGNTPDVVADAIFNRGMTFKRMRRDAEAVAAYEEVVKKYPESPLANMARIRIGYIHEDARDYEKAILAYRDLAAHDNGKLGAEAMYLVGDCHLGQKKTGEALLAYAEVVERFKGQESWVVTALAKIGEVEESLGHDAKALAAYEKILDIGGDPNWIKSAQSRIDALKARVPQLDSGKKPAPRPKAKSKPKAAVKKGAKK